jgi:hypothetical protein
MPWRRSRVSVLASPNTEKRFSLQFPKTETLFFLEPMEEEIILGGLSQQGQLVRVLNPIGAPGKARKKRTTRNDHYLYLKGHPQMH